VWPPLEKEDTRWSPLSAGWPSTEFCWLVDGVRITSERRIGVSASFINLGDIDRVEINRGPYSVFHGSGALGGIINIITKSPSPYSPFKGEFHLAYNTIRNERAGSASLSGSLGKWGLMFSTNGKMADDYSAPSGKIEWSRFKDYNLMFKINRKSETSEFYTTMFYYDGTDIGKPSPTSRLKPRWYPNESNTLVTAGYKIQNFGIFDNLNVSAYALRSVLETQGENLREETLVQKKRNLAKVESTNFGFRLRGGRVLGKTHTLNFGFDFFGRTGINDQNDEWKYNESGNVISQTKETSLQNARRSNLGLYLDDKIQLVEHLAFNVGARFDVVQTSNLDLQGNRMFRNDVVFFAFIWDPSSKSPHIFHFWETWGNPSGFRLSVSFFTQA